MQQLVKALQGNKPAGNKTAEALTRVSKLFTKNASAKKEVAKAKKHRNRLRANPLAWITTHPPREAVPPPRVDMPVPRVTKATQANCQIAQDWCEHNHNAASCAGPLNTFPTATAGQHTTPIVPAKLHLPG